MELLANHIFLLLLITLLGTALGKVRIRTFALGSSGIIFVALAFGHYGFTLPKDFQTLGLVLFIYSVGLQAGPGFFHTLRSRGLRLALGAIAVIGLGFLTTLACAFLFGFDTSISAGLFAGALTSTPGLAVAVEMAGGSGAPAAYGLTYFFGVIGVVLFVQLLPKILRVNVAEEEKQLDEEASRNHPHFTYHNIELTNPNLFSKQVKDIDLGAIAPVVITRLLRPGATEPILVAGDTRLHEGDHLRIAGLEDDLQKAELFLGKPIQEEIEFNRVLSKKDIVVSKKTVVGMTIGQLNCREIFNVQITRITRNGIDLPATPHSRLYIGDTVHAVGDQQALKNVTKIFGDNVTATHSIDLLPILIGLFLGFLLGQIPLYIPYGGTFTLGTTGGVLVAGILLSSRYKTGPFIWMIPGTANTFIRELGLILFLATVGTKTGATFVATIHQQGAELFIAGVLVTLVPLLSSIFICRHLLELPFLRMIGVMTGSMTSTPGLAAAGSLSPTHYTASSYATVYPAALISMILFTKLLVLILA